jgi:POT family proton-dependent oligopeptide transporter
MGRFFEVTPLRKISMGLFLAVPSFVLVGLVQSWLDAGQMPNISWQLIAYAILTTSEVLVSITCLEFSYTQAPNSMKSLIMGFFMLSVSLGNIFTAVVNAFIQNPDGSSKLAGASYFYFFAGIMFVTAFLFLLVLKYYTPKTYFHEEK